MRNDDCLTEGVNECVVEGARVTVHVRKTNTDQGVSGVQSGPVALSLWAPFRSQWALSEVSGPKFETWVPGNEPLFLVWTSDTKIIFKHPMD